MSPPFKNSFSKVLYTTIGPSITTYRNRGVGDGWAGWAPQDLGDKLTLYQPVVADFATKVLLAHPAFGSFIRS